jgi:hypothetical protein
MAYPNQSSALCLPVLEMTAWASSKEKGSRMSKRKARQQKSARAVAAPRRDRKPIRVVVLLLCIILGGGMLALWRATRAANSMLPLPAAAPAPAVSLVPTSPSKEYIYAGGRLLATEEPTTISTENVIWANAVGVTVNGNSLTKTAGTGWANAGAASTKAIASGDGYMEFTATEVNTHRMCGLGNGDTDQNYIDIDYAVYAQSNGTVAVYEDGYSKGAFGAYVAGDRFRVAIEGGVVKYRKNGTLFYTSTVTPTYPLLVDSALYTNGATITNAVISGLLTP